VKHENFAVSTHIIYSEIFVVTTDKHSAASPIRCSQKLGLVRMVGYHYKFIILQYFEFYPNLNEVGSVNANLIWIVAIYPNFYNICKSE